MIEPELQERIKHNHFCVRCGHATWQWKIEHLDMMGRPICLTCPHEKFWILRGNVNNNCEFYQLGTPLQSTDPNDPTHVVDYNDTETYR